MPLNQIEDALRAIAAGPMAVVIDDEHRENEGDLVMAAEKATPQALAFMVHHTSGVICTALPAERLTTLQLIMSETNGVANAGRGISARAVAPRT